MRIDWVPYSAASLVLGATALSVGSLLLPSYAEAATTVQMTEAQSGLWRAVAVLYFVAAVMLTLGMPSILTLFHVRGARFGLTAVGIFTASAAGTAGFAMLLMFARALVENKAIPETTVMDVTHDTGLTGFLYVWIGTIVVGELLLAVALLRARTTPRWIPVLLLLHVVLLPIAPYLPDFIGSASPLLIVLALSGLGILAAGQRPTQPAF
jgi:Na+/citrate or Na+/malate symporter